MKLPNYFSCIWIVVCLCAVFSLSCHASSDISAPDDFLEPIGPTPIRFYTGNLSVGLFMDYWGTPPNDQGAMTDELVETMKRTSNTAMCDYITWCYVERQKGQWDFAFHKENARLLGKADLGYSVFCWLHFPPKWYEKSDRFVPYVNLETGKNIPQLSLWSPDMPRIFDTFYAEMSKEIGPQIEFIRLAMPSEYGEIGYCAGYTKWLRPQANAEPAYWCGDVYAQADFRKSMLLRYGSLKAVNAAWQTDFKSAKEIAMPDTKALPKEFSVSAPARLRWVDFIEWYQQSWVSCLAKVTKIVERHFPDKDLIASLGYAGELSKYGNDQGRHIKAMARLGQACQSPGDVGYFATRRVSSACRHYQVPYYTEPPDDVPPERELNRIFMDISNGVQTWFDYLPNVDRARDYFRKYKQYLTAVPPRTTVAVWHPTLDHCMHPDQNWSGPAYQLSEPLRDVMAYEIVDDRMIIDGVLETLGGGVRQLILAGASWLDAAAWQAVHKWVQAGGVLIVLQDKQITDLDGSNALWKKQTAGQIPSPDNNLQDIERLWNDGAVPMGAGLVLTMDRRKLSQERLAVLLGLLCETAGTKTGHPEWNARHIDGLVNGVLSTRFDDKLLYFNTTTDDKQMNITFRETDFPKNGLGPAKMTMTLDIPARTIIAVPLVTK